MTDATGTIPSGTPGPGTETGGSGGGGAPERAGSPTGTATYLYAVMRPAPAGGAQGMAGVGGAPVRVLSVDGLECLVSTVPLSEFGESALRRNLGDLGWLERTARAHDEVVRAATAAATTAPLRLATVYRDDASAIASVRDLAASAGALLDRLDGRVEWGVKVFAAQPPQDPPADTPDPTQTTPGTAYLRRRRAAASQRATALETAAQQAESVYRALAGTAVAGRRHRLQDPALSGVVEPMLLNAAFLVDAGSAERFRTTAGGIAADHAGIRMDVTGPWPPYSFAELSPP